MTYKVLLIDGSRELCEALEAVLADRYEVLTAGNGEDALTLIGECGELSAVVCDFDLPGMNGIECLRETRVLAPRAVRIMLAGHADVELCVRAMHEAQAFRFLQKPVDSGDVAQAIADGLEDNASRQDDVLVDELLFAKDCLKDLAQDLEKRLVVQLSTIEVLHAFAMELNSADSLEQIAHMASHASYVALQGHGVHVQLWDDRARGGVIEADAGPEMSTEMHRERLQSPEGQVGEVVVDMYGAGGHTLDERDLEILTMIAVPTAVAARNELRRRERDEAQHAIILSLARLAERRDNETGKHIERVSLYCKLIAESLRDGGCYVDEISDQFVDDLVRSAPLHDIGKVGIPDSILLKPGKLAGEEWEVMKTHAAIGADTLDEVIRQNINSSFLLMGRDIAWGHHERWDGTGYPRGLKGEEIPLSARILALADIYDALTSERPYKKPWTHAAAIEWIEGLGGGHIDPEVVVAFLRKAEEADQIRARLADEPDASLEDVNVTVGNRR